MTTFLRDETLRLVDFTFGEGCLDGFNESVEEALDRPNYGIFIDLSADPIMGCCVRLEGQFWPHSDEENITHLPGTDRICMMGVAKSAQWEHLIHSAARILRRSIPR